MIWCFEVEGSKIRNFIFHSHVFHSKFFAPTDEKYARIRFQRTCCRSIQQRNYITGSVQQNRHVFQASWTHIKGYELPPISLVTQVL